ncbi:MAG: S41 family peptidase [Bacteroidia bacterium]
MSPKQNPINNSSRQSVLPLVLSVIIAIGFSLGMNVNRAKKDKFSQILDIIQNDYVDSTKNAELEENTIDYLLSQLDPHSSYIPAQLTEINERQIRGNYQGLGIEYIRFMDTLFVFNVYEKGPSDIAGLKAGDRLLFANQISLTDSLSNTEIQEAIQGNDKPVVDVKVYRRSSNEYLDFIIPKGTIVLNSSEVFYMVNKTLGYIRLERFSGNTHNEFKAALDSLKKLGLKDLVLDLRNNGGGLVSEAAAIANEFLQKDEIITYTYGFHREKNFYKADGTGVFTNGKLIVLINHNTASASEILAGSLQDNDRAVILGNRSFGKGLVQEPFRLMDGSMLRLTIARYYTPSGRSIQKSYNKNIESYRNEIYNRDQLSDTLNPVLDTTTKKEFFSRNGRLLISGGGIRPDVFLRDTINDSTEIEMLMPGLFYSRIFDIYVLDHMSKVREEKSNLCKNVIVFQEKYSIPQSDVIKFINIAKEIPYLRHIKYSNKTASIIRKHLKAALAYRLFGDIGRSQIINSEESVFSTSFDILKNYERILNIGRKKKRSFDY